MANIVTKKNQRGAVRGWEVRTKLTTVNGSTNRIRDEYGEYWENVWVGHTKDVARSAYYSNEIPKDILNKIPSWEKVATD